MSRAARYLVRFDDICPAMNWDMWGKIETVLRENGVKPILAVVPDNKDPLLDVGAPVSDFWERVRGWQGRADHRPTRLSAYLSKQALRFNENLQ